MVSVIFVVLEVSFWALTTVVKLPRKFLTLIIIIIIIIILYRALLSRSTVRVSAYNASYLTPSTLNNLQLYSKKQFNQQ